MPIAPTFIASRARRLGSVQWNREKWGNPEEWERHGNNWAFHADACGQSYEGWKSSLVQQFLDPFLGPEIDILEIGPGHGRWTEYMMGRARSVTLVDLNATCIDICRDRFGRRNDVSFIVNDGRSLPVPESSVDVIWSFGSFVHFEQRDTDAYLGEFRRVLRPGGRFVVHHAGWPEWSLRLVPITALAGRPGRVLQHRLAQGRWRPGGDRMAMSPKLFASRAAARGLRVDEQMRTWGPEHEFGLAFHDMISIGSRPPSAVATDASRNAAGNGRS